MENHQRLNGRLDSAFNRANLAHSGTSAAKERATTTRHKFNVAILGLGFKMIPQSPRKKVECSPESITMRNIPKLCLRPKIHCSNC